MSCPYSAKTTSPLANMTGGDVCGLSISRLLCAPKDVDIISLGCPLLDTSSSLPDAHNGMGHPLRLLDLAPGGVCSAASVTRDAGGLLHHRFTLAPEDAIYLSTALFRQVTLPGR
jgi:hypothetical protein